MKAALYLRVSSTEQTSDNQLPALKLFAESRGWEIAEIYSEAESAWKVGHQKELARLLNDCRNGRHKFDVVLVWALDRLSREGPAAILNLISTLSFCHVRVLSYQELWTEAPGQLGELLFAIAGWVAKMESERRSERTLAGLSRAVKEGKTLGRPMGSKDKRKRKKRIARVYA